MKNLILPSLVILAIVAAVVIFGTTGSKKAEQSAPAPAYFNQNAKVMFFYQDSCSWCQKEESILEDLAKDGYRVKPMDVKARPDLWNQYNITGTPTFIAPDGTHLNGYTEKAQLKEFLDKYK